MAARYPIVMAGVLCLVATACEETAIVVEVTRDIESTPEDIDSLRFYLGVADDEAALRFVDDADPQLDSALVDGRALENKPYRLLLRPGDAPMERPLMLAVLAYRGTEVVGLGLLEEPVRFRRGQVLQWRMVVRGQRQGRLDLTELGCLRWTSDEQRVLIVSPRDRDCDRDPAGSDCNDLDPAVHHEATERCANLVDDDCDASIDEESDRDGDGVTNCGGDCDDRDATVAPGAEELCDGKDNDCSGVCDDGINDADGDRYTVCARMILADGSCTDEDARYLDCDDADATVNPAAQEVCDAVDNDCSGTCDEPFDADGDTFTSCGSHLSSCTGEPSESLIDCAPSDATIHPGSDERCNGIDDNCDGERFAASSSCYVIRGEECVLGTRLCDDADGGAGFAPCEPAQPTESVAAALCEAYAACEAEGAADPLACAKQRAAVDTVLACRLFYRGDELCEPRTVPLPVIGTEDCVWTLLDAAHYTVGLLSEDDPAGASVSSCMPLLTVLAGQRPFALERVLIAGQSGRTRALVGVELAAEEVAACPEAGLVCTSQGN